MDTKRCCFCKKTKPLTEFHKRRGRKDGRQGKCAPCSLRKSRKHYRNNKAYYLERNKKRQREILAYVDAIKNVPCQDCGGRFHPCAMDFDHRDPALKIKGVGVLRRYGNMRKIKAEIEKCDIVCQLSPHTNMEQTALIRLRPMVGHRALTS